jgi:hypothetical protein
MTGKTLTKADLKKRGLKPTGNYYGIRTIWRFYKSNKVHALLEEMWDGRYLIISWVKR